MKKEKFFPFFVFITGASIMAVEMVAFQITVPYFGNSVFVWAAIIATVMVALSIGYYTGGKVADKRPEERVLFFIIALGGFLVGAIAFLQKIFLETSIETAERTAFGSFPYVLMLFALPVFLLAFSSPFVIRICNRKLQTTGRVTGTIYAFSTIGSVVGIYASSFFMIPAFGSRLTLLILSLILLSISAFGWLITAKHPLRSVPVFIFLFLSPFSFYYLSSIERDGIIYQKESFYGLIRVWDREEEGILLDINAKGRWSVYHPEKVLTGMYFDYYSPLLYLLEEKDEINILIIGHAGGAHSRQISHFFEDKNIHIDGIEIDPLVTKVAREFFHIDEHKGLTVYNEDGRIFLKHTEKEYDLIIADAYTGALYLPFHLATQEFFQLASSRLKEDGIFAQHLLAYNPKDRVARCVSGTIKSVFPYSYYIETPPIGEILVGSKLELDEKLALLGEKEGHQELRELQKDIAENFFRLEKEECILTDNRAPTEMLRELDVFFYRIGRY